MAQHAQYPHEQQNAGHGEQVIAIHPIMSMHCEFACKHDEERAVDGDIDHRGQQSVEERGQIRRCVSECDAERQIAFVGRMLRGVRTDGAVEYFRQSRLQAQRHCGKAYDRECRPIQYGQQQVVGYRDGGAEHIGDH